MARRSVFFGSFSILYFVLAASLIAVTPLSAVAIDVTCTVPGADSAGWSIASNGDFDGDGTPDIAVGAPCSVASGLRRAGRVFVFSGATGRRLVSIKGEKDMQRLGSALSFISDLDGDGRDDLIVGSLGWDTVLPGNIVLQGTGKIDVHSFGGGVLLTVESTTVTGANFGEAVAAVPDLTGDGLADIVVGAADEKIDIDRKGQAYLLSGADGSFIDQSPGVYRFDSWGSVVASAGDVDGDGTVDVVVGSNLADLRVGGTDASPVLEKNNGIIRLLSGASFATVLAEFSGNIDDKLGRSLAPAGTTGLFAGVPGADPAIRSKAGSVRLFDWSGQLLREFIEPTPEINAALGTSVASPGDLDGLGLDDVVAGAPNGRVSGNANAGRVYAFSADNGNVLWTVAGTRRNQAFGKMITAVADLDGDGIGDVAVGAPGDAPKGRRGAGTVRILSGASGSEIMRLKGRRGLETRIFVVGVDARGVPRVRSFDRKSRRREVRLAAYRRLDQGALSVAILGASSIERGPKELKVVIGTGRGASNSTVKVFVAGRRRVFADPREFRSMSLSYTGGVNVGAGDVTDDTREEIIVVHADSPSHTVKLKVFQELDTDPLTGRVNWVQTDIINAFKDTDRVDSIKVNADGANVAVGDVLADSNDKAEIVVGPINGAPVVRILSGTGSKRAEWLAYLPNENFGTSVAIGDLDGDGVNEIVTSPATGLPWIKAFTAAGTPFTLPNSSAPVSFFGLPVGVVDGLRVAVADVDLDGAGEILVASGPGTDGLVQAFEVDGTPVLGWRDLLPFGPTRGIGLAITATDRFLRH